MDKEDPTHPEFCGQKVCIDQWLDDNTSTLKKKLRYDMDYMQLAAKANWAINQSEFVQSVREIREADLKKCNELWFKIQQDPKHDKAVPEYIIPFPTDRAEQIKQQRSYNKEVSILSGVATYVGFPAAPSLEGVTSAAREEDLKAMRVSALQLSENQTIARTLISDFTDPISGSSSCEPTLIPAPPPHAFGIYEATSSRRHDLLRAESVGRQPSATQLPHHHQPGPDPDDHHLTRPSPIGSTAHSEPVSCAHQARVQSDGRRELGLPDPRFRRRRDGRHRSRWQRSGRPWCEYPGAGAEAEELHRSDQPDDARGSNSQGDKTFGCGLIASRWRASSSERSGVFGGGGKHRSGRTDWWSVRLEAQLYD